MTARTLNNPGPNPPATAAVLLGLASVVPGVGIAAIMLGIIGMTRSRELPGAAGRGRAFAGVVLGLGSLLLWAMLTGAYFQGRALMRAAPAVRRTPDFIRLVGSGNANAAKGMCTDKIDLGRLADTAGQFESYGTLTGDFQPLGGEPHGDGVRVEYALPFEKGTKVMQVDWVFADGEPKVNDYRVMDPPATQPAK